MILCLWLWPLVRRRAGEAEALAEPVAAWRPEAAHESGHNVPESAAGDLKSPVHEDVDADVEAADSHYENGAKQ